MKKMFILLIFLATSILSGQDKVMEVRDQFGIALGGNTGYGLTYKTNLDEKISLRGVLGYAFNKRDYFYSVALTGNYSLRRTKLFDFYFSAGGLVTGEKEDRNSSTIIYKETDYRAIIGLGFELRNNALSFSVEFHQIFENSITDKSTFNIYPMVGFTFGLLL